MTQSKNKKRSFYAAALAFAAVLFLIVLEISLRIVSFLPSRSPAFINQEHIEYRTRANFTYDHIRTNSNGFNDIERPKKKPSGVTRIAVIGDSFVFGPVKREDNLVSRLAAMTDEKTEVLNMGINGTGPITYLGLLKKEARDMDVDIACVMFYTGNDLMQSHPDFITTVWLGIPRPRIKKLYTLGASRNYFYVYRILRATRRKFMMMKADSSNNEQDLDRKYLNLVNDSAFVFHSQTDSFMRDAHAGAIDLLQQMKAFSLKRGIRFFVVLAPAEIQVSEKLKEKYLKEFDLKPSYYDFEKPHGLLGSKLKEKGILYLDLLPVFRTENKKRNLYLLRDSHWNAEGNRLAAREIWKFMRVKNIKKR